MLALTYTGEGQMELRDVPAPTPAPDEYLIAVKACGICGSDVEGYLGKTGRRTAPMVMGHECAGEVVSAPPGGALRAGARVAIFPKFYCGHCRYCEQGLPNLCEQAEFLGVMDFDGAMAEYICVREEYLIPLASGTPYEVAAMAEPLAVAYNGVSKLARERLAAAQNIMVVGAGAIGLLVLMMLRQRGAKRVIVSDTFDTRLELAQKLGAAGTINPRRENFAKAAAHLTDGALCELSVEAVGIAATAQSSLEALQKTGAAVWIGNAQRMVGIDMQAVVTRELTIRGNYIYDMRDFRKCVHLLESGEINPVPLITHRPPLSAGVEAFRHQADNLGGSAIKTMLVCE